MRCDVGTVVLIAGLLVIAAAFTYWQLRASKRKAEAELQAFAVRRSLDIDRFGLAIRIAVCVRGENRYRDC